MAINQIDLQDIDNFKATGCGLDFYQEVATQSAIYPGQGSALGLLYCTTKLNGEAGELSEHVGKALRDDELLSIKSSPHGDIAFEKDLEPERRSLIVKEVGDCLWYLSAICNELDITLAEAATMNLEKLADRQARGKLQGSGDER